MSIGENLKRNRLEREMTQEKLAEAVGVTAPMITQVERGTKTITLLLANDIAKVLGCRIDDLLA